MAKKKVSKASKRRLLLFGSASIVTILYFLVSLSTYIVDIYNLKSEEAHLEKELVKLQSDEKELNTQIDMLKDVDYLARYARENYLYSKDGEIVLKIESNKETEKKYDNKLSFNNKYIFYTGGGMLGLLVLYVLLKRAK